MKYKLIVIVSDDTEDTLLMLRNKECVELIGKTASELSAHYTDVSSYTTLIISISLRYIENRISLHTNTKCNRSTIIV